jgi:L-lactate utilization protein LutB
MNYTTLASEESVTTTTQGLQDRGIESIVVDNGAAALEKIKELIPQGSSVMNGSSRTLEQIGYVNYLKSGQHGWNNLHEAILAEKDHAQQAKLRRQALLSDYYLGSVHAVAETGEFIIASNTGSQLSHVVYSSPNVIFIVSTQKIVPTLNDAMKRLEEHVFPLENQRMMDAYGMGSNISKVVTFKKEAPSTGRKVRMILVQEKLGF